MTRIADLRHGVDVPRHGVTHLAALLSFDPFRDEWLALVDEAGGLCTADCDFPVCGDGVRDVTAPDWR